MKKEHSRRRSALALAVGTVVLPLSASAAPLDLSTAPAGTAYRAPAPNVIVSVDDSGSMGAEGMATLRSALLKTFTAANVPDGAIRLAWQSMTGCYAIPSAGDCHGHNAMRVLDVEQRKRFTDWVATLAVQGGTPSHRMLLNAGEYLRQEGLGIHSPWASIPGTKEAPLLGCRKSYNVFMTDGGWNAWTNGMAPHVGNADGTSRKLPDGTSYDATSPDALPYRDAYGSAVLPTLSDLAFHYWATDLQPTIADAVPKRMVRESDESLVSGETRRTVSPYWNPRNDPATWQHMVTYTVGFNAAANWNATATPNFGSDTWTGGDYPALMTGRTHWADAIAGNETTRMPELWHMALNGRGKYVPAPDAGSLATAFKDILATIGSDQTARLTSLAGSSLTTRSASTAYSASYSAANWTGHLAANGVAAGTGLVARTGGWGNVAGTSPPQPVTTATLLDAATWVPQARTVLSHDGSNGIHWVWKALAPAQKAELNTLDGMTDTLGEERLNYLRGDRSREINVGGRFRNRASRQGDIVNSKIWYLAGKPSAGHPDPGYAAFRSTRSGRTPMLYVGGNDGMLHGFSASDGTEKIAYVPQGLHSALAQLTSSSYVHRYYVDGSPFSGDLKIGNAWRTYLAGFPGGGGRGYFVLDVTDPELFATASPSETVVLDRTSPARLDDDIGHIVGAPVMDPSNRMIAQQITKMNDGRWALVMGNGYNSVNEQAVLLLQYLDGARELLKLKAGPPGGNGLGAPRLVDLNGDRVPDVAYAGDLQGNLWKFDLNGPNAPGGAPTWRVAFGGSPLFVAKDSANRPQPITAAPAWLPHPAGGVMVVFGTGRHLTDADRADVSPQTVYGVRDNTSVTRDANNLVSLAGGATIAAGRSALVAQSASAASSGVAEGSGARVWTLSSNAVDYTGANARKGWYLDLPDAGERVLDNLQGFDGQLVDVASTVPAIGSDATLETCTPSLVSGRSYLNTMNAVTGAAPKSQLYAYSPAAGVIGDTKNASRIESGVRYGVSSPSEEKSVCGPGQTCTHRLLLGKTGLRPSWRQLQ
ncbi:MAG: PilC/PilY family type IV pilus protein [Luteibacter sp.]